MPDEKRDLMPEQHPTYHNLLRNYLGVWANGDLPDPKTLPKDTLHAIKCLKSSPGYADFIKALNLERIPYTDTDIEKFIAKLISNSMPE